MKPYDPKHWRSHLFDLRGSVFREIISRVTLFVMWATFWTALHEFYPERCRWVEIPESGHNLVGVAIGLLLVFRTNASYDRFWEGRRLWGSITNDCRNLGRLAHVWLDRSPLTAARYAFWLRRFPSTVMHRLQGSTGEFSASQEVLDELGFSADDVAALSSGRTAPQQIVVELTRLINDATREGHLAETQRLVFEQTHQRLIDCLGGCERIHSTPLPYAYAIHLRRSLILYGLSLPLALVSRFQWSTVPAVLVMMYILLGIEEIGVEIEDPFGTHDNDLPLDRFCQTIAGDLDRYESGPAVEPAS